MKTKTSKTTKILASRTGAALIGILACAAPALAGTGSVGNGGDAVYCRESSENSLHGYYVLDYLVAGRKLHEYESSLEAIAQITSRLLNSEELKKIQPLPESPSPDDISKFLKEAQRSQPALKFGPDMAARSLSRFVDEAESPWHPYSDYFWQPARHGVHPIDDANLNVYLPPNCDTIVQLVRRVKQGRQVKFTYDANVMKEIKKKKDQYSWILIHEWLWSVLPDAESIRQVNELLHSEFFFRLPPGGGQWWFSELMENLTRHLIVLPESGAYVSEYFGRDCQIDIRSDHRARTVTLAMEPSHDRRTGCMRWLPGARPVGGGRKYRCKYRYYLEEPRFGFTETNRSVCDNLIVDGPTEIRVRLREDAHTPREAHLRKQR